MYLVSTSIFPHGQNRREQLSNFSFLPKLAQPRVRVSIGELRPSSTSVKIYRLFDHCTTGQPRLFSLAGHIITNAATWTSLVDV